MKDPEKLTTETGAPVMSANSAVTVFRSPSAISVSAASPTRIDRAAFASDAESGALHCPQNLKPGGFAKLHLGQISASGLLHCPQNFIPSGFSNPHLLQRMIPLDISVLRRSTRRGAPWRR